MKIYAPVKDFNGLRNGVRFVDGIGETNNPQLIAWFENHGYKVPIEDSLEKCDDLSQKSLEKCDHVVEEKTRVDESEFVEINNITNDVELPDFEPMTPNDIREWAIANGFGNKIRNTRSKEKLIQIIRG